MDHCKAECCSDYVAGGKEHLHLWLYPRTVRFSSFGANLWNHEAFQLENFEKVYKPMEEDGDFFVMVFSTSKASIFEKWQRLMFDSYTVLHSLI